MRVAKDIHVAGVVLRDGNGRYLLVQEKKARAYGLWNMPAGHVDAGETPQQAAIREGYEETGYAVRLTDQNALVVDNDSEQGIIKHAFKAEIVGGKLTVAEDELLDAKWFTYDEILQIEQVGKMRSPWTLRAISKVERLCA